MKRSLYFLLIICLLLCFAGCDTYEAMNHYPFQKFTVWYCEEIDFEIRFSENEYGNLAPEATALEWNGETYMVCAAFQAGYIWLTSDRGQESVLEEDVLLSGQWRYKSGNMVIEITEEGVFDGKFDTLVFKPLPKDES